MKLNYPNYVKMSGEFFQDCNNLSEEYESYVKCLNTLTDNGVQSGTLHNELAIYASYVSKVPELVKTISQKMKMLIIAYLADMNQAQNWGGEYILYKECYAGTRNYSDESFRSMRLDCDDLDSDANIFEEISDWTENLVAKAFKFIGEIFLWDAAKIRYCVMEINDITKKQLDDIQNRLHAQEDNYYTKAVNLLTCVSQLKVYISTLNRAVMSEVADFSMKPFTLQLDRLFMNIVETLDEISVEDEYNQKAIEAFIKTDDVEKFFDECKTIIIEFITNLAGLDMKSLDFWIISITQMFDGASKEMMGWIRELFGEDYGYDTYLYDNEMMKLFDEMTETKSFEDAEYNQILSDYKTFMKLLNKGGDALEKYLRECRNQNGDLLLDKRTRNYKYFKAFIKQFGNAENIMKYGTDIVEMLAAFTAEYEKNLEVLNVIIDDCSPDSEMGKSLARIKLRYENRFENAAMILKDKLGEWGNDVVKELLKDKKFESEIFKFTKVFKIVGWVDLGIEAFGEITGLNEEAAAKIQLLTSGMEQINSAENAYKNALSEVKECDPNSSEYNKKMKDFSVSFEYYRVTIKRLFDRMAKAASGPKKDYYRYCTEELNNLSIENHESFKLKSYSEYVAA